MSKINLRDLEDFYNDEETTLDDYENEREFKKKTMKKIKKNNFQDNFENKNSKKKHDIKIKNAHKLKDKFDEC
jgi:hypothetical protein